MKRSTCMDSSCARVTSSLFSFVFTVSDQIKIRTAASMELKSWFSSGYLRVWQELSQPARKNLSEWELEEPGVLLLFAGYTGSDIDGIGSDPANIPILRELIEAAAHEAALLKKKLANQGPVYFASVERQRREIVAKKPRSSQISLKDVETEDTPLWHQRRPPNRREHGV